MRENALRYYRWSLLSALCAGPVLAHGDKLGDIGEVLGGPLWTALGLGAVLFLAYGVSWFVSQPVLRRAHDEESLETLRLHNSRLRAALGQIGEGVLVVDGALRLQLVAGDGWQGETVPLVGQHLGEVDSGGQLAALVADVTACGAARQIAWQGGGWCDGGQRPTTGRCGWDRRCPVSARVK